MDHPHRRAAARAAGTRVYGFAFIYFCLVQGAG